MISLTRTAANGTLLRDLVVAFCDNRLFVLHPDEQPEAHFISIALMRRKEAHHFLAHVGLLYQYRANAIGPHNLYIDVHTLNQLETELFWDSVLEERRYRGLD